jgi:ankyrin repeat protein
MSTLPARPNLDQLRQQAKDLLRAAQSGDTSAVGRIRAVSDALTLTTARLAIAREYGYASWARLKTEVDTRTMDLGEQAARFCEASVRDWTGRAGRMLAATPEIAGYNFATAVILGDIDEVRKTLARDPGLVTRRDPRSGWTPLHAVSGSRWHRLDPARADGLTAVARMLLDAGADPRARVGQWTPLRCAVAGAANPPITRLLLDRGAVPEDHDLYLACFGDDDHESLRLLLDHMPELAETAALAAPISTNDIEGVRLLLEAGADPRRPTTADLYGDDDDAPWPAVYAGIRSGCSVQLVELLLTHGADPNAPGPDGRSPHQLAVRKGRADLARLVRRYGAQATATEVDSFLAACLQADRTTAERQLDRGGVRLEQLTDDDRATIVHAAQMGNTAAIQLMLDLGFPINTRGALFDAGGTALHAASYCGSAAAVALLLDRGADLEARDTAWESTPLVWATIGSGERPTHNADPDWIATVRTLLDAGASTDGITLSPDDEKPPSPQVAELLRSHGVPDEQR